MDRPCYYIRDPEAGRVLIPGCMGAAVYGIGGCTCPKPPRPQREGPAIEGRVEKLEREIAELRALVARKEAP